MIPKLTLAIAILISFAACTQRSPQPKDQQVVSETLEKEKSGSLTKRTADNLVVAMYNELVDKTPELQQLEKEINQAREMTVDSLAAFNEYDSKNDNYYAFAKSMSSQLHDSILGKALIAAIESSITKYNQRTANHETLRELITSKNITVSDLHMVLKILRTLPVIEQYQQKNLPPASPLQETNKELDELIRKIDAATKSSK